MDRYEIAKYEANAYLSSINRVLFVGKVDAHKLPPLLDPPVLSTTIPREEKGPDPEALIRVFESIFPVDKSKEH